jgi:hypothetical protein
LNRSKGICLCDLIFKGFKAYKIEIFPDPQIVVFSFDYTLESPRELLKFSLPRLNIPEPNFCRILGR